MSTQRAIEQGRLSAHLFNLQVSLQAKQQLQTQLDQVTQEVSRQMVPHDMAIAQSILEAKDQICKLAEEGVTIEEIIAYLGGSQVVVDVVELVRNASFEDVSKKMSAGFQIAAGAKTP